MKAYQVKVLLFLVKECKDAWIESSCDESEVPGLTLEDREAITKELYKSWGEEDEYEKPNDEFGISSLCKLATTWLEEERTHV